MKSSSLPCILRIGHLQLDARRQSEIYEQWGKVCTVSARPRLWLNVFLGLSLCRSLAMD